MLSPRPVLAVGLLAATMSVQAQTIPDSVAAKAVELRDAAMRDTIAYELVESLTMEVGPRPAGSAGADLSPLRKAGMPVLDMTQDGSKYFDFHHTADDTLDKVDRDDLNQNVAAYVTAAYVAAYIEADFGRIEPDTRPERSCSAEDDKWVN